MSNKTTTTYCKSSSNLSLRKASLSKEGGSSPRSGGSSTPHVEVVKAVSWLKSFLAEKVSDQAKLNKFENSLVKSIMEKVNGHWFENEPLKGQAYRSLSVDKLGRPDPLLVKAAKEANIENIFNCFPYIESITLWIDPGEVAAKIEWTYLQRSCEQSIYKKEVPHTTNLQQRQKHSIDRSPSPPSRKEAIQKSNRSISPVHSRSTLKSDFDISALTLKSPAYIPMNRLMKEDQQHLTHQNPHQHSHQFSTKQSKSEHYQTEQHQNEHSQTFFKVTTWEDDDVNSNVSWDNVGVSVPLQA